MPERCFWCEDSECPEYPFPPTQLLEFKLPGKPFPPEQLLGSRMFNNLSRDNSCWGPGCPAKFTAKTVVGSRTLWAPFPAKPASSCRSTGSPVQLQRNQQLPEQLHFADVGGAKACDTAATSRLRLTAYAVCGQDAVQLAHWRVHVRRMPSGLPDFSENPPMLRADKYITYMSARVAPCTVLLSWCVRPHGAKRLWSLLWGPGVLCIPFPPKGG